MKEVLYLLGKIKCPNGKIIMSVYKGTGADHNLNLKLQFNSAAAAKKGAHEL